MNVKIGVATKNAIDLQMSLSTWLGIIFSGRLFLPSQNTTNTDTTQFASGMDWGRAGRIFLPLLVSEFFLLNPLNLPFLNLKDKTNSGKTGYDSALVLYANFTLTKKSFSFIVALHFTGFFCFGFLHHGLSICWSWIFATCFFFTCHLPSQHLFALLLGVLRKAQKFSTFFFQCQF